MPLVEAPRATVRLERIQADWRPELSLCVADESCPNAATYDWRRQVEVIDPADALGPGQRHEPHGHPTRRNQSIPHPPTNCGV